jgi:hypothetical protein
MSFIFHECPTCGAKENEPCRTPKGRKKPTVHDTRPFSVNRESQKTADKIDGYDRDDLGESPDY